MNTLLDLGRPEWGAVKGKEYIVIRLRNEE